MAPSRKDQMALMAMMDGFVQSQGPCTCSTCTRRSSRLRSPIKRSTGAQKDSNDHPLISKATLSAELCKHICSEHRDLFNSRKSASSATEKVKPSTTSTNPPNRNDKVNSLLKAESIQAIFDVFKMLPTTNEEKSLSEKIQKVSSESKSFPEAKSNILDLCGEENTDLDAVFGLLATFRQERNLLITATLKSNSEREKSLLAIQRVDHLMYMLQDVAKEAKDSKGAEVRGNLGNIIVEIHELAKTPSVLYDELLELREEHLDLIDDHEDEHQKYLEMQDCHETLHEKNKKLQEEHTQLLKDYTEAKKKFSTVGALKTEVSRLETMVEESNNENTELKKEVEKLSAELVKINALKHENTQLKKKLAVAESAKEDVKPDIATTKKKKGKKGGGTSALPETSSDAVGKSAVETNDALTTELKILKATHSDLLSELDTVRCNVQQLESQLKKIEAAKTRAIEKQQLEQATAQNWKELSESRSQENDRLREELEQSVSRAITLQDSLHQLERSLAESQQQANSQVQKQTVNPRTVSQDLLMSQMGSDALQLLRKIRTSIEQLVYDLDESKSYGGDPWNIVGYTAKVIAEVDQDLDELMDKRSDLGYNVPSHIPETIIPSRYGISMSSQAQVATDFPRVAEVNQRPFLPGNISMPSPSPSGYRSIAPPGLGVSDKDHGFNRTPVSNSTNGNLPAPVGTGRPGNGRISGNVSTALTPSPISTPATSIASTAAVSGSGVGNGAAGVDWSMWARPQKR